MSDFDTAIPIIFLHEGVYSNDKDDTGGATKYGITLAALKAEEDENHDGHLDGDINLDGIVDIRDVQQLTLDDAKAFYQRKWDKKGYQKIDNQLIATKVFDLAVNMGESQAIKILQRALWACWGRKTVLDDGILGDETIKAINSTNLFILQSAMRALAVSFYQYLVLKNPIRAKYLDGWITRALY